MFACLAEILGHSDPSWLGCRDMVGQPSFHAELVGLRPDQMTADVTSLARDALQDPDFTPDNLRRASPIAADVLDWLITLIRAFDHWQQTGEVTTQRRPGQGQRQGGGGGRAAHHEGKVPFQIASTTLDLGELKIG